MVEGFSTSSGNFSLAVTCESSGPANDDCENAIALECDTTVTGSTSGASDSGQSPSPDVFYTYTGSGTEETVTLSLCDGGTDYDSLLRVFDDGCNLVNLIVGNDDFCGIQSELSFISDGTTTYTIMVEGFSTSSGNFSLAVTCESSGPANDDCENAIALECDTTVTGSTSGASDSGQNLSPDVFYTYTGSGTEETVTLSLCDGGTDYDSLLRVFDDGCNLVNQIVGNDDFCGLQSELSFASDGTTTYTIMVEGFGTSSGNFSLAVTCESSGPANDDCENAIALECDTTVTGSTSGASDSGQNLSPDVFYTYTGSGTEETVTLSLCDGGNRL